MRRSLFQWPALILLLTLLFFARQSSAQSSLDPSLLPPRTIFYLLWHGAPQGDARKSNALMSLWDDPDAAQLRNSFALAMLSESKKQKEKPTLTREELNDYASLLDNSFLVGYLPRVGENLAPKTSAPPASGITATPAWNGIFFVYDRSGKEAILSKAILRMRSSSTAEIPTLTNITVGGAPALKIENKSSITYWTENGNYAVSANELSVFEEILNRLAAKAKGPSLVDSPAYLEAKPILGGGILELFLRVPRLSDLVNDPATTNPQVKAFVKNIKLDALHVLAGHLSLEGPKTRVQGAILGDAASGTLFDIWSDGKANPDAVRFLSANTVSFNESEINFLGIYKILREMFLQGSNSSAQMVSSLESATETRLGMPLADALALTTGEVSSIQNNAALDDSQQVRILGIRNKPDSLKLLRTIMGDKISSERNEGNTTYMKISLGGSQGSAGVAQWNFYHLALTPDFLLGSSKSEPLHTLLAQQTAAPDANLAVNLLAARSKFPAKLNGFSYFDFQKVDWPGVREKWIAEAKTAATKTKTTESTDSGKKLSDWLATVNPEIFPRHLHTMTGASWKDAKGVHFDEWIE